MTKPDRDKLSEMNSRNSYMYVPTRIIDRMATVCTYQPEGHAQPPMPEINLSLSLSLSLRRRTPIIDHACSVPLFSSIPWLEYPNLRFFLQRLSNSLGAEELRSKNKQSSIIKFDILGERVEPCFFGEDWDQYSHLSQNLISPSEIVHSLTITSDSFERSTISTRFLYSHTIKFSLKAPICKRNSS